MSISSAKEDDKSIALANCLRFIALQGIYRRIQTKNVALAFGCLKVPRGVKALALLCACVEKADASRTKQKLFFKQIILYELRITVRERSIVSVKKRLLSKARNALSLFRKHVSQRAMRFKCFTAGLIVLNRNVEGCYGFAFRKMLFAFAESQSRSANGEKAAREQNQQEAERERALLQTLCERLRASQDLLNRLSEECEKLATDKKQLATLLRETHEQNATNIERVRSLKAKLSESQVECNRHAEEATGLLSEKRSLEALLRQEKHNLAAGATARHEENSKLKQAFQEFKQRTEAELTSQKQLEAERLRSMNKKLEELLRENDSLQLAKKRLSEETGQQRSELEEQLDRIHQLNKEKMALFKEMALLNDKTRSLAQENQSLKDLAQTFKQEDLQRSLPPPHQSFSEVQEAKLLPKPAEKQAEENPSIELDNTSVLFEKIAKIKQKYQKI